MSDSTRKEGQYWVLPKATKEWAVWFWVEGGRYWFHPVTGKYKEYHTADLITVDEKLLERTAMGADYYRREADLIDAWISATLRDDPRKIMCTLTNDGIRVVVRLRDSQNLFLGTVQTLEELQQVWKMLPTNLMQ